MKQKNKIKSNIIGLDMGLALGKFFLNTDDLHFGYWPNNDMPTVKNFSWAQDNHSQLIINNIPKKVRKFLDVGCGAGNLSLKLLNNGYDVDCVIPSEYLAKAVKEKIKDRGKIFISKFEDLTINEKYDLILFSESFQYVDMKKSINKISNIINQNGYLLICDYFKRNIKKKSLMGGGHNWLSFQNLIKTSSLNKINDLDITNETAPTIDFLNNFCQDVLLPVGNLTSQFLSTNHPFIAKFIKWKMKNKLQKLKNRYLSGKVNGNYFKTYKIYKFLIFQNNYVYDNNNTK